MGLIEDETDEISISAEDTRSLAQDLRSLIQRQYDIGKAPDAIPADEQAVLNGEIRTMYVATHDIPGLLEPFAREEIKYAKLAAELANHAASLGTYKDQPFPNPGFHWGIIVGDYVHELNAEANLDIVYQNKRTEGQPPGNVKTGKTEWVLYDVGHTKLNDRALQQAGEQVIKMMIAKHGGPTYNPYNNNCQLFVQNLMATVCEVGYRKLSDLQKWKEQKVVSPQEQAQRSLDAQREYQGSKTMGPLGGFS